MLVSFAEGLGLVPSHMTAHNSHFSFMRSTTSSGFSVPPFFLLFFYEIGIKDADLLEEI